MIPLEVRLRYEFPVEGEVENGVGVPSGPGHREVGDMAAILICLLTASHLALVATVVQPRADQTVSLQTQNISKIKIILICLVWRFYIAQYQ